MSAFLVLEDGTVHRGRPYGAHGIAVGEVVFTTSMTGYQEVVTDPSFAGQLITFTQPMIGNYGVEDGRLRVGRAGRAGGDRARGPKRHAERARGLLRLAGRAGHRRPAGRRHARDHPPAARRRLGARRRLDAAPPRSPRCSSSCGASRRCSAGRSRPRLRAAARERRRAPARARPRRRARLRRQVARSSALLSEAGARVTVFPWDCGAAEVLAAQPDGIVLGNGPGDPAALPALRRGRPRPRRRGAAARDLPRPPAARPGPRPRDLQAALRPPRRQPSGARARHRPRARDRPEPRLRGPPARRGRDFDTRFGPAGSRTCRSTTARSRASS